ncbi:MAG: dihydroneopterin aldolase [Chloroflexi bacterium]|nr:dihydroneopterin aldolase [Chloroflexota bacterium]
MTDVIRLNRMSFFGHHGVLPEEQKLGQRYEVDLEVRSDLQAAGLTDDLDATLNYSELYRTTESIIVGSPRRLIEALAERIATAVLERFGSAQSVVVRVRKLHPPIEGAFLESSEVEIERWRL